MRVAIVLPTGGLLAGCALGLWWTGVWPSLLLVVLIASSVLAVVGFRFNNAWLLASSVAVGFASGGALLAADRWHSAWRSSLRIAFESMAREERREAERAGRAWPEDDSASVVVVGVLRADAALSSGGGVSLNIETRRIGRQRSWGGRNRDPAVNPVEGGALLTVVGALAPARMSDWRAGRTIRAPAQLHRPSNYLDRGVPDQERVLARRGVALVGTVKSGALVEVVSAGGQLAEAAASVRAYARRAMGSAVGRWSPRAAGIVTAIVIGDRTGLDDSIERQLQEAGTYHVIAISGGNIAILAGLTLIAFRVAGVLGRAAMMSAIVGLVAYGYVVGGGASVDRATLMAVVYFAGRAIDLRGPPLHALVLVAGLLLVADPLAIADPAFLLTCGATAAILGVATELPAVRLPRLLAPVAAMIIASASAEAALLPIGSTIFSRVTFAGLVLNLAAIPLMAVAQIAGMIVVPASAISAHLASLAGWCAYVGAEGLVRTAELVHFAPFVTWRVAPPAVLVTAVYYAGGITAWMLWRRRARFTGSAESRLARAVRRGGAITASCAAMWIVAEPWTLFRASGDGRLHVTFIDVGQGDSALIRFPRGATLLVDAGGLSGSASFDVGDRVVAPVLRDSGVRRLGTIALTHGDIDHVGGAAAAIREFRPWDIWEGIPVPQFKPLQAVHAAAANVHSRSRSVQIDDVVEVDGVSIVVRHPSLPDWERQDVRNDDSIVLEVLWRDVSFVLTGDIGAGVEQTIAPRFRSMPLRILKVPHHGSLSSSSERFVQALSPRVAVVSVGRSNRFGHPAKAVLKRYEDIHAQIFRTDRDGAVTVDTDGRSLDIRTFTGRAVHINASTHHEDNKGTKDTQTVKNQPRRHEGH